MKDNTCEWPSRITPCTTVPTSPYSEKGLNDFKVHPKTNLLYEFEQKILYLQEIIAGKTLDINQRMVVIQNKDRLNHVKRQKIAKEQKKSSVSQSLDNFKIQELVLINEDLQNRVELFDSKNKNDTLKIQNLQDKLNEYSLIKQLTERRASDINQKLLTLYRKKLEKTEEYHQIAAEKNKISEVFGDIQSGLLTLKEQNTKIHSKQAAIEKKKHVLKEELRGTEIQKTRIFKLQFYIDCEKPRINSAVTAFNEFSDKNTKIVEKIRNKIISVESLAEKTQVQEKLLELRKNKVKEESSRIFKRSTEIFKLLKLLELKNLELEKSFKDSEKKEKAIQNRIIEVKENKELEARQTILMEKLKKIKTEGK